MNVCIFIVGPTASGKSSLALRLAERFNGAIISADSMQIYREMNVGTAKPTPEARARVPHEMIDVRSVFDPFSVYDYKKEAVEAIRRVQDSGKLPFVVGGTGLYIDALLNNTEFGEMETDPVIHNDLENKAREGKAAELLERLRAIDPVSAGSLHEKDVKRIIRALEVYLSTGKTLTEFKSVSHLQKPFFDPLLIRLDFRDRAVLYEKINQRVDEMIAGGLFEETKALLDSGAMQSKTAAQAIGYKELVPVLTEHADPAAAIELLKQRTRNYAKRQITWFNRYDAVKIEMDRDPDPYQTAETAVRTFILERRNK